MGSMSIMHWIIVLVVVLLFFGPKRLPDLAKSLGESIREFKKAVADPNANANTHAQQNTPQQQIPTEPPKLVSTSAPQQVTHNEKQSDHQTKS